MFRMFGKLKERRQEAAARKATEQAAAVEKFIAEYDPMDPRFFGHGSHPLRGYTNFGRFEVHGVNPETGRKNKKIIEALNQSEAIQAAVRLGLQPPISVREISCRMATERQYKYMDSLDIEWYSESRESIYLY